MSAYRRFLVIGLLLITVTDIARAQSKLTFPHQLGATDMATAAFAVVNTSPSPVTATFVVYGSDGSVVAQSPQVVPGKGQLARLASQIFPGVAQGGWVQIQSPSPEVQGFELVGDFATVEDGAGPAVEGKQLVAIKFSSNDIIDVVNTSTQSGTVQVVLYSAAGSTAGTRSIPLGPLQGASIRAGDIANDNSVSLIALNADVSISSSLTTKLPGGPDIGITNATQTTSVSAGLFIPFEPSGGIWTTHLGVSNLTNAAQNVVLTLNQDSGSPITVNRSLGPNASVGDTVANLFGVPSNTYTAGWIEVTGSGALTAVAAYQDSSSGALAIVPAQSSGSTNFFFGHIASLSPWYTGLALLNLSSTAANVEVYALDGTGQLIGSVSSFSLPSGRRTALLSDLVPQVLQRASDGGWVFVRTTNNVPLLGFELFGHFINPILANVQGFVLPATSSYLPPGASPLAPTVDHLSLLDINNVSQNQFNAKDVITYVATVANSGSTGSAQLTFKVTDPNGQVMFTTSASITLGTSSTDYPYASYIPGNALNGQYTFSASLAYQGQTSSKSISFTVANGTTTPSVNQDASVSMTTANVVQFGFRPGDKVRFLIPFANFTSSSVDMTIQYQLTGPGNLNAGKGSIPYTAPTGMSSTTVDIVVPASAPQSLYLFTSSLVLQGVLGMSSNGTTITVVPPDPSEAVNVDVAFVADSNGVPQGGYMPGSSGTLFVSRFSSFGIPVSATAEYKVTASDGTVVLDHSIAVTIPNGQETAYIPFTLSPKAAAGTYRFDATITYQDNSNTTKSSTGSTTFVVGSSPPPLTPAVKPSRALAVDVNLVTRTTFNAGETFILVATTYSTYAAPVSGTVEYDVTVVPRVTGGYSGSETYSYAPGIAAGPALGLTTNLLGTFTFMATASVSGVSNSNSTQFAVTPPNAVQIPELQASSAEERAKATRFRAGTLFVRDDSRK